MLPIISWDNQEPPHIWGRPITNEWYQNRKKEINGSDKIQEQMKIKKEKILKQPRKDKKLHRWKNQMLLKKEWQNLRELYKLKIR